MSWSLINKGFQLIENDIEDNSSSSKKDCKLKPTNKSSKKQNHFKKKNVEKSFSSRKVKGAFELYKKNCVADQTLNNLKALERLDSQLCGNSDLKKVREHHFKTINKNSEENELRTCLKNKEESVFTDEDFEKMAGEWHKFEKYQCSEPVLKS